MEDAAATVSERIRATLETMTRAERQLALSVLGNYPASGIGPIAALAKGAEVSVPTVARMVRKIGFDGYPDFQAALREELGAAGRGPAGPDVWAGAAPSGHILNRFTEAVIDNVRSTLAHLDPDAFDAACALVGDEERHLFVVGGRITHTLAEYLFLHLQIVRPNLTHVQSTSSTWPHHMLNAGEGDVFVVFDVRRYETNTLKLAEMARARGARIVLFTDEWRSPVHRLAEISLTSRIVAPSAWDSAAATMLLVESMIAAVQVLNAEGTRARVEALEEIFDETRMFRKFV